MYRYLITVVKVDETNGVNDARWSSALKIHELYDHLLVMVSNPYLQHGFHHNGPMRENMTKLISMGYLNT